MPENRFQAFKVAVDGSHEKWGHVRNLTLADARDEAGTRFPHGKQYDDRRGKYFIWSYSLMPQFCG